MEGEREEEKCWNETEPSMGFHLVCTLLVTEPATCPCALTGDRTSDLLLCGMMPNWPTSVRALVIFKMKSPCPWVFTARLLLTGSFWLGNLATYISISLHLVAWIPFSVSVPSFYNSDNTSTFLRVVMRIERIDVFEVFWKVPGT